jgi:TolB-like protein
MGYFCMRLIVDDIEIDTERFELRRNGEAFHVEPLVFDLMRFFAANPGRVVGRDEIINSVWQGRIVSDATISSCIKSARRAFGDDGDSQKYIRTVRGRGFEFVGTIANEAGVADAAQSHAPLREHAMAAKPFIAVLPFANLSAEVEEYFSDGLTEDIIMNLSRFRDLRVIASASTFQYKNWDKGLAELCSQLNAGYVVKGSVRRAAGRVRISVQLIEGVSGVQLWGDRYDRDMVNIFDLQDEVSTVIAAALGVKMQDAALQNSLNKSKPDLDAYDCLLRARRYTWMLDAEAHAEARDLLEKAVLLDPLSADAHALLANIYLAEHRFETNPRPDPIGRAFRHATTATRLDPLNAYAHCWLAIVHFFKRENSNFQAEVEIALDLNPNDPETIADIGHYLTHMGDFVRGPHLVRRAQQLNPLHAGWYHFSFARKNYDERNYEEVIADMQRAAMPNFFWTHMLAAAAKGQLGHPDAAAFMMEAYRLKPDLVPREMLLKWNAAPGDLLHLMEGLYKAGVVEIRS